MENFDTGFIESHSESLREDTVNVTENPDKTENTDEPINSISQEINYADESIQEIDQEAQEISGAGESVQEVGHRLPSPVRRSNRESRKPVRYDDYIMY